MLHERHAASVGLELPVVLANVLRRDEHRHLRADCRRLEEGKSRFQTFLAISVTTTMCITIRGFERLPMLKQY